MSYTPIGWLNDQAPSINQTNLNKMDNGIKDAHNLLDATSEDINTIRNVVTNELLNGNAFDILPFCEKISRSANNVTFTWNSDGSACTVSTIGTASARTADTMFDEANSFPAGMKAGGSYRLKYNSSNVYFVIICYKNGTIESQALIARKKSIDFTIPDDASGLLIQLVVSNATSANETVSPILLTDVLTNDELNTKLNTKAEAIIETTSNNENVVFSVLEKSDCPLKWAKKYYINENTGVITYSESGTASVTQLIRIPNGATAFINTFSASIRYATYDENGATIQIYTGPGINIEIPSTAGRYFALQYGSLNDETLASVSIHFEYPDEIARETDVEKCMKNTNVLGFNNEKVAVTGNPIIVHDAANDVISAVSVSDGTDGEILSLCGKNLFNFQHKDRLGIASNGVTFHFDINTQEYEIISSGATGTALSANNTCTGCTTLDGVTAYHNFHFRMKSDTPVTITPNYNYEPYYDDKVKFQLIWVENGIIQALPIGYEGATIVALAGVEYGIRLIVSKGFTGTVKLKPQIEIGGESTVYERYRGVDIALPLEDGTNLFNMPAVINRLYVPNSKTKVYFDYIQETFTVQANEPANDTIIYNNYYDGKVNTLDWNYISKFTPGSTLVMVAGIPEELVGLVFLQVSNGTKVVASTAESGPKFFTAESGKEYGFRIIVKAGAKFEYTFKPVITTGKELLKQFGTKYPTMSLYTNGGASLDVTYSKPKLSDEIMSAVKIAKGLNKLTGGKIINSLDKISEVGPVVCFIDDDTTNPTLVQRFHDILAAEGVVGNYAVEMRNVNNYPDTMPQLLLGYEQEGFGMLYHCYKQDGDADRYWESGNEMYDEDLIRQNFYRGLREYKQIGFNSARYWVTPYGVNDNFIQSLAKEADMECLLSCPTATYTCNGILTLGSNVKRYNMPRCIFLSDSDNDWQIKKLVDGCASDKGMLVIVTHVNSWPSADIAALTARLTALIQYIKASGCKIQNFMTAYQTFKPLLMLNELF